MKPVQPWRQPLKERQAFAVHQETWKPTSVSQSTWKDVVYAQTLQDKIDAMDISRDTKFDLDPEGKPVGGDEMSDSEESVIDISKPRPINKMSLQVVISVVITLILPVLQS